MASNKSCSFACFIMARAAAHCLHAWPFWLFISGRLFEETLLLWPRSCTLHSWISTFPIIGLDSPKVIWPCDALESKLGQFSASDINELSLELFQITRSILTNVTLWNCRNSSVVKENTTVKNFRQLQRLSAFFYSSVVRRKKIIFASASTPVL